MGLTDTLKSFSPALYRLRMFAFIVAGVVLAISTYYLLYVRNQTGYFNDRNFRKLSLISSQIGEKLKNAGSVMEKTSERFIHPLEEDEYKFATDKNLKTQNIAELQKVFKRLKGDSPQIVPFNIDTEPWSANAAPGSVALVNVRPEGDSSWLYFDYVTHGIEAGTVIRVQAKTELNGLIQPFLTARIGSNPDQFQNILIAEAETARVILQYETSQVRLASLDKLTSASNEAKNINLKEVAQTSNAIDIALAGANYRLFSHPLKVSLPTTSASAPSATWIITGLIKSDAFKSVAWSLSIPYTILIICGFVVAMLVFSWPFFKLVLTGPKDRFRTVDVYLLVFATMIVLAVATAFGLYAYVYITVETQMDGQVRTLAGNLKTNFNEELNNALRQLDTLSNNQNLLNTLVEDEKLREAGLVTNLGGIGRGVSAEHRRSNVEDGPLCPPQEQNIYQVSDTNKINILPCILSSCETFYPYFDTIGWIDKTGTQRAKWTVRDYTTQYTSVADRAYFQNIQKKHFYELGDHKFWLEPIISKTTGRNQVEISQPIKEPNSNPVKYTNWTIAADTRLLSLMDPVLPDAYGFVIINNDGKVLFHSDEVHHLGENLLQECDDDSELRSAVIGRTDRALNVRYSGQVYRFFVTTVEGFPDWSLVVFRNKQPLRSAFVELLTSLTALFLLHMLILMGAFTIFFIIYTRNRRKAWLWPEERKIDRYVQLRYIMLVMAGVSLLLTLVLHGQSLVWVSAGLALVSAAVFFLSLRYGPWSRSRFFGRKAISTPARESANPAALEPVKTPASEPPASLAVISTAFVPEPEPRWLKRYDWVYAWNLMLLVLLIAIVPMGAFFKYEYESQIRLFIKHAQFSMATALERRDDRIRAQYANVAPVPPITCGNHLTNPETNILTRRLGESWDVYDQFFFGTARHNDQGGQTTNQRPSSDTDLLSALNALLPVSSQSAIERRGLMASSSVRGVCHWDAATPDGLILNLARNGKQGWPWRRLSTSVPILGFSVFPLVALLASFLVLLPLIYFMVRKVFLLDVHKPTSHSLKRFLCDKVDGHAFVVVNAPFFKKDRFAANNQSLYFQRFSDLARSEDWTGKWTGKGDEKEIIAFDQFEYHMENAETNKQRLKLLKDLLSWKKTLLLFSTVDPSKYKFENGDVNGYDDKAGDWAELLISNFVTEYAEDTDDRYERDVANSFRQSVNLQRERIICEECLQGRKKKEVNELIDLLYNECAPRVPLQAVGLQILKSKDFSTLSKNHLLGRIVNQARPYYSHIWNSCSPGEKQTLCHLAQDRRLSHRDPDIQPLLRRALIIRDEGLNLFNESFGKFVLGKEQLKDVAEDEQQARQESWWQTLKVPILASMIFIAGFLFWTQQDFFSSSLAVITGITGLITAVFKMTAIFQNDSARSPKEG